VTWDRERYLRDVLEPARKAGNVPPPDLYVRYGLPTGAANPAAFAAQIRAVTGYWRELKSKRTYARLADTLLAAHAGLERAGRVTPEGFARRQARARHENIGRLGRLAETEAGAATHVGPATVARLRAAAGGAVSDEDVAQALGKAGVRIVRAFPQLPASPHPKQADLAKHLAPLGRWLSAEIVFGDAVARGFRVLGGFRLASGEALTEEAIARARRTADALPYSDPGKTHSENVLAVLRTAARQPGELDTLLLSEVTERLRQFARSGFVQKGITTQAAELGLDYEEAGLIAAALLAPDAAGTARQQVESELSAGRLRNAQQLSAGLPASEPLRERIAALDAEVVMLTRRADQEMARGRPEQAVRLLTEALGLARDDESLAARLAAVPPPPPRQAVARPDGDHVTLTWEPSPALAGQLYYRVMRGQDLAPGSPAAGTAVVTRLAQCFVTDTEAPPGAELFYSVFASRGGEAWSAPAVTPAAMFTPDVREVSVRTTASSVTATWRLHPAAESVLVARRDDRPPKGPGDGTTVMASATDFTDTGLRTGARYYYWIAAVYRAPSGRRRHAAGWVEPVVSEPAPKAVTDLGTRTSADGASVLASWTRPGYGQVRLALADKPPPWPAGTLLRPEQTARLPLVREIAQRAGDGRDVVALRPPPGRSSLFALTMGHNVAAVGNAVEVRLAEPVRSLSAHRMQDEVRLAWVWPDDATDAVVRWPGHERRCSRRAYGDEGGVTITAGPAETAVEVHAVYPQPGGRLIAPGVLVRVPARGVAVHYRIRRISRLRPRQRLIELSAERETQLPALVVVESTGDYAPDDAAEGDTLQRIGPQPITATVPVRIPVEVTRRPTWLACFTDPASGANAQPILLFPPPAEEMRIR
jgi:hypothetical protein